MDLLPVAPPSKIVSAFMPGANRATARESVCQGALAQCDEEGSAKARPKVHQASTRD